MQLEVIAWKPGAAWAPASMSSWDSPRTLVLGFGASELADQPDPLSALAKAMPSSVVLGCSSAGEIFGNTLSDGGASLAFVRFDRAELRRVTSAIDATSGSRAAGRAVAEALVDPQLRAIFVLSDGLHVNGSELVAGINSIVPPSVVVTGGLAADGDRFKRTWVFDGEKPRAGVVSAVGIYGDSVSIRHGSKGGWDSFGPERRVTRSEGNVLYELDGRPALRLYKDYLGERAAGLPATALLFPLALRSDSAAEKRIVRTVLSVDDANQSLVFAGDVPQGSLAQLMRANFDRLIEGASAAATMTAAASSGGPVLSVAISCVGRRLVLGERIEEELEATLDALPPAAKQVGFYSYGEISPYASGTCDLHNQTMTLTTIAES
jgi:hypothetical protein